MILLLVKMTLPLVKSIPPAVKIAPPAYKNRSLGRKDRSPGRKDRSPGGKDGSPDGKDGSPDGKDRSPDGKDGSPDGKDRSPGGKDCSPGEKDCSPARKDEPSCRHNHTICRICASQRGDSQQARLCCLMLCPPPASRAGDGFPAIHGFRFAPPVAIFRRPLRGLAAGETNEQTKQSCMDRFRVTDLLHPAKITRFSGCAALGESFTQAVNACLQHSVPHQND